MGLGLNITQKKYVLILSKQHMNLSIVEMNSLLKEKKTKLHDNVFLVQTKNNLIKSAEKSAYIRFVYELLWEGDKEGKGVKVKDEIKKIKQPYSVKVYDIDNNRKLNPLEYANKIWRLLESPNKKVKPKVDLKNPKTELFVLIINKKEYYCIKKFENENLELKRKSHLRPQSHPTSLDPRISKACINILTKGKKQKIIDPMCGAGGLLIEAGLLGNKIEGYDIDEKMLSRCDENLRYYGLKHFKLLKKDALSKKGKFNNSIVDLPYGKNSKLTKDIEELYSSFIKKIGKNVILMVPDFMKQKVLELLSKKGGKYEILDEIYLHKSLKKVIIKFD